MPKSQWLKSGCMAAAITAKNDIFDMVCSSISIVCGGVNQVLRHTAYPALAERGERTELGIKEQTLGVEPQ